MAIKRRRRSPTQSKTRSNAEDGARANFFVFPRGMAASFRPPGEKSSPRAVASKVIETKSSFAQIKPIEVEVGRARACGETIGVRMSRFETSDPHVRLLTAALSFRNYKILLPSAGTDSAERTVRKTRRERGADFRNTK